MAYLGKSYTLEKHERFDEFMKALDAPAEFVERLVNEKSVEKLEKNGDTYTLTLSGFRDKTLTFKSGVEFEEPFGSSATAKTTITVDGNTVTQVQKLNDFSINIKREFNGDKLVATITTSKWDGTAKRYFSA